MNKIMTLALLSGLCFSCNDSTLSVGKDIIPESEKTNTETKTFEITAKTIQVNSVLANTSNCYLGAIENNSIQGISQVGFLSQYHILPNYKYPAKDKMIVENNKVVADSCDLYLYFNEVFGHPNTTLKVQAQKLSDTNIMPEDGLNNTSLNPNDYLDATTTIKGETSFNIQERLSMASSAENAYKGYVQIKLPTEYATNILNKYYEHPEWFKNSYQFIHHVCPGFGFSTSGSLGAVLKVDISTLNLYFRYHTKTKEDNDTIVNGMHRMVATPEVIQNNFVKNIFDFENIANQEQFSYITSPAGVTTELDLNIEDFTTSTKNDSINQVRINLQVTNTEGDSYLKHPEMLVLLRKKDLNEFFESQQMPDMKTSFYAAYNANTKSYVFINIVPLINVLKEEKNKKDSQKLVLVPVTPNFTMKRDPYSGKVTKTLISVENCLSPTSVRLKTGKSLTMDVIYSHFK